MTSLNDVKHLIIDLDDTLFDTYGLLVQSAAREACEAMIKAGLNANVKSCLAAREELFHDQPRADVYLGLVDRFGLKSGAKASEVRIAGFTAFHHREIKEAIHLFPDAAPTIQKLKTKFKVSLVTSGDPQTQQKKLDLLKVADLIEDIHIVDIRTVHTKQKAFKDILRSSKLRPYEFASIGNRLDAEIKEAKELGMKTVFVQKGEYIHLTPTSDLEVPDARITNLRELIPLFFAGEGT